MTSQNPKKKDARPGLVRGEVTVDLGGGATGTVSAPTRPLDAVMAVAAELWDAVRRAGVAPADAAGADALMARLQKEYHDFATSYPIPFRWMVQAREYEPRAFEKFLREHVKVMYKDRKEFMAAQGEYLVILYKTRHPRAGGGQLARYREAVAKSLQKDDEVFAAAREKADAEVKRLDAEVDAARRQRLAAHLRALKAADLSSTNSPSARS